MDSSNSYVRLKVIHLRIGLYDEIRNIFSSLFLDIPAGLCSKITCYCITHFTDFPMTNSLREHLVFSALISLTRRETIAEKTGCSGRLNEQPEPTFYFLLTFSTHVQISQG